MQDARASLCEYRASVSISIIASKSSEDFGSESNFIPFLSLVLAEANPYLREKNNVDRDKSCQRDHLTLFLFNTEILAEE